jgi:hypothetical protein
VIDPIIPGNGAVTIKFALIGFVVETFVIFALVFELWKGWRAAFFIGGEPLKAVVADVLTFFEGGVVALVAFAAVELFESVAFALLLVVGLVGFADG